jgi:hypothetical protein
VEEQINGGVIRADSAPLVFAQQSCFLFYCNFDMLILKINFKK